MTKSSRRALTGWPSGPAAVERTSAPAARSTGAVKDAFFRHVVTGMRNGVLALDRDGALAIINDEAYRIFGITRGPDDIGRPAAEVLRDHPRGCGCSRTV